MTALEVLARDRIDLEEVCVWRTDLSSIDLDRAEGSLSVEERLRAQRYRFEVHRHRYMAARSWLREVLAEIVGTAPAAVELTYGPLGKPALASCPGISFNLSHSYNEAVLAVAWNGEVGVDIEIVRSDSIDPSSAAIVLSSVELAMVASSADRDRALLRCWVRKEAYAKALGGGLDRHLASLTITTASGRVIPPAKFRILDIEDRPSVVLSLALAEHVAKEEPVTSTGMFGSQ